MNCGCSNQLELTILDDIFYTADLCDTKCIQHKDCHEFALGKGILSGKCYLHGVGCIHNVNVNFDCFTPSPNTKPNQV